MSKSTVWRILKKRDSTDQLRNTKRSGMEQEKTSSQITDTQGGKCVIVRVSRDTFINENTEGLHSRTERPY